MRIVMKFGGTSVAGAEKIRHAAGLALKAVAEGHQVVVVVSAMDGVTEDLLDLADAAGSGNRAALYTVLGKVRSAHEAAARALGAMDEVDPLLGRLETLVSGILAVGELTARSRDAVVAFGERLSTAMMGVAMGCRAMDGHGAGIVTDDHFGEADPLMEISMHQVRQNLEPIISGGRPVVVSGFIAANQHGVTTTLGRGGSDYTATILGAAIRADEIWIWSDVDGLMSADPRAVPEARLLTAINFAEAVEMGKFGAKSMHPRALEPAAAHRINVRMRSTFNPDNPGTLISDATKAGDAAHAVRSVPMLKKMAMVTVGGAGMIGRPGTAAAVFTALAEARVNAHMICQSVSEAGISVVVSMGQLDKARAALERALVKVTSGPHANVVSSLKVQENLAIIAAVGQGMKGVPGVAARVFVAVAEAGVNINAIAQGSSELSIAFAVDEAAGSKAVAAVHRAFGLGG